MDRLEKVIAHVRALRELGATQVSIDAGDCVSVTFAPPVVVEEKPAEKTPDERKKELEDILLHSAS